MTKRALQQLNTRLAAALLFQNGELSISDIEALPRVGTRTEAMVIARQLLKEFDARMRTRPVEGRVAHTETFIELQSPLLTHRGSQKAATAPLTRADFDRALRRVARRLDGTTATD